MKTAIKLILISGALLVPAPLSSAQQEETTQVAITSDHTAPFVTSYNRGRSVARKACQINGRIVPMKRLLERTSVAPMPAQFVLQTKNQDLIAYYEVRMGEPPIAMPFIAD